MTKLAIALSFMTVGLTFGLPAKARADRAAFARQVAAATARWEATQPGKYRSVGLATRDLDVGNGTYNIVSKVRKGSLAAQAGVKKGDIFHYVNVDGMGSNPAVDTRANAEWRYKLMPRSLVTFKVARQGSVLMLNAIAK